MTQIPRSEHPHPQMKREHWKNLNGEWDFSFDFGCSGIDQKWQEGKFDMDVIKTINARKAAIED